MTISKIQVLLQKFHTAMLRSLFMWKFLWYFRMWRIVDSSWAMKFHEIVENLPKWLAQPPAWKTPVGKLRYKSTNSKNPQKSPFSMKNHFFWKSFRIWSIRCREAGAIVKMLPSPTELRCRCRKRISSISLGAVFNPNWPDFISRNCPKFHTPHRILFWYVFFRENFKFFTQNHEKFNFFRNFWNFYTICAF